MADAQVGQTISVGATVKDTTGALADVGTGPTCAVTQPDGTAATAAVLHNSTGSYTASLANAPQAGRYLFVWSASGANSAGFPYSDYVNVWPTDPRFLVTLAVARDALNLTTSNTVHDDEIRLYVAAATPVLEDITGPILTATVTQTADGGRNSINLYERPASKNSVTVTENGTELTVDVDYVVNVNAGVIYRGDLFASYPFLPGVQNIQIDYTTGAGAVPPNLQLAATEELRFLYQIGQQGQRPSFGQDNSDMVFSPSGFAVPRRVVELCQPQINDRIPGLA